VHRHDLKNVVPGAFQPAVQGAIGEDTSISFSTCQSFAEQMMVHENAIGQNPQGHAA